MATSTYRRIRLTEDEMAALDDGQDWWKPGWTVHLGGYVDEDGEGTLSLGVRGETHDNWTTVRELPAAIRERLLASED